MAKKQQIAETTLSEMPVTDPEFDVGEAPQDFADEGQIEIDAWWKAELGCGFTGTLLSSFVITDKDGKKRNVVTVRVARKTRATSNDEMVALEPGQILGVSLSYGLRALLDYEPGAEVWAKVTGMKDVGRPQPMWVYELRCKGKKKAAISTPEEYDDEEAF